MGDSSSAAFATGASESKYYLSDRAYCCEFDDGAIILDMGAVTYLGIDAKHLPNLRVWVANWPNSSQRELPATCSGNAAFTELIADLLARGLLTTTPIKAHSLQLECPTKVLAHTEWATTPPRIPVGHILHFCTALLSVLLRRRAGRLASLLRWIRRHQTSIQGDRPSLSEETGSDLLGSFFRLRIWFYTAYRHCLLDSLVLSVFLTKQMVPCALVIGVSTKPFAAHAWVQIDEYVLNDTVEHVQTFTPILEVGDLS